jgi:hypothetical protein
VCLSKQSPQTNWLRNYDRHGLALYILSSQMHLFSQATYPP